MKKKTCCGSKGCKFYNNKGCFKNYTCNTSKGGSTTDARHHALPAGTASQSSFTETPIKSPAVPSHRLSEPFPSKRAISSRPQQWSDFGRQPTASGTDFEPATQVSSVAEGGEPCPTEGYRKSSGSGRPWTPLPPVLTPKEHGSGYARHPRWPEETEARHVGNLASESERRGK